MIDQLFKRKSLSGILADAEKPEHGLKKALGAFDLISLGIGAIIGAGIFASVGTAAAGGGGHPAAGPALILSFVLTGIACGFSALCYAEFASMIPIAGSAYTYAYATLGELIAWIIGWDLIIEYAVGNIAVAISWAGYFKELLAGFGIHIPPWMVTDMRTATEASAAGAKLLASGQTLDQLDPVTRLGYDAFMSAPHLLGHPVVVNIPAVLIVAFITCILIVGIKESTRFNNVIVGLKLLVLLFFIAVGAFYVRPENWTPFAPNGLRGVSAGAALIFFSYIGFDAVSTAAEETKNPKRDLPIGIIGSLVVCTIIYVIVTAVLTGMVSYTKLGTAEPLATALSLNKLNWAAGIASFGAVVSMTAVLLVFQLGQPRIFFSMARDGLLPKFFSRIHPKFKTPHVTTILTGAFVAFFAAFANINEIIELTNIGTLFAFVIVCGGIIWLRKHDPDRERPFACPWVPVIPILGILSCIYLMVWLPWITWVRFILWLVAGLFVYFLFGYRNSRLRRETQDAAEPAAQA